MDDAEGGDGEDEQRYALAGSPGPIHAALMRAGVMAGGLDEILRKALPGRGVLDVRTLPLGVVPVVRVEFHAEAAANLTGLIVRFLEAVEGADGWQKPEPMEFERGRVLDDVDIAQVNPGWYAVLPGVRYGPGLRRAYVVSSGFQDVLSRVLVGPLEVDPDCWQDGAGVVRLTLTAEDASRLTKLLANVLDWRTEDGRAW